MVGKEYAPSMNGPDATASRWERPPLTLYSLMTTMVVMGQFQVCADFVYFIFGELSETILWNTLHDF